MRRFLLRAGMWFYRNRHWRPVEHLTHRSAAAQHDVLQRLLHANRDTGFGVQHGFKNIRSDAQFREQVPVQTYETLRPYIEEQRLKGTRALTAEAPLFYAQTSGTTGKPKYIPITPTALAMYRAEQALFSYLQFRACPQAFTGKALGIMGAAIEGRLDSGHEVGSVSGHLYQSLPSIIQSRFVVPPAVSDIADYEIKYLVILRLALAENNITYLGSPNPSTFLRLSDLMNQKRKTLMHSLETGQLDALDGLDAPLRTTIAQRLKPASERAAQLRAKSTLTFANVWPSIRLLTTWTGGSCGIALNTLRKQLPSSAITMELGYQSSECRGTIALQAETAAGLPPLHHHFFEFVEQASWENVKPEFLTLDQLELGKRYYILITTVAGLYRYFMNDLLEVTEFFHRTPLLRFIQKGKGVTNLTGEKLYEIQVIDAVQATISRLNLVSNFFLMVADEEISAYRLFIELDTSISADVRITAADIDQRLGELNIEYFAKRASNRLAPLTLAWLKRGTAEAYKSACVRAGQREGQFKPVVLQYRKSLALSLDEYVVR
ncbi:MAG: GH3 auxin-responsive promoter family protein [Gammaproteobacteria bacterium]|nr:GH3 auxin-responsive promoter family protein [Gammaproteobacteria bacterium]